MRRVIENNGRLLFLILVLTYALFAYSKETENAGDSFCRSMKNDSRLNCVIPAKCWVFQSSLKTAEVTICGTKPPRVCCSPPPPSPPTRPPTTPSPPTTSQTSPPSPSPSQNINSNVIFKEKTRLPNNAQEKYNKAASIVQEKCQNYSELIYVKSPMITPPGQPPIFLKYYDCHTSDRLIVGGNETAPKEFPHMALLGYTQNNKTEWKCGGSLISDRFVLSAGHCESNEILRPDLVLLGELNFEKDDDDAKPTKYSIAERFVHQGYHPPQLTNDIILYKLNNTVIFNAYIRPICLSTSSSSLTGRNATVTGWGFLDTIEKSKGALMKATVTIIENEVCEKAFRGHVFYPNGIDKNTILCAGNKDRREDICQGDSGGPLQISKGTCMWEQIGIVSAGPHLCADNDNNHLGVIYTKVAQYIEWIQRIVWPQ